MADRNGAHATDGGITIIVPTIGRPSLRNTLRSIAYDAYPDDTIIVVSDGRNPDVERIIDQEQQQSAAAWIYAPNTPAKGWGHEHRNYALDLYVSDGYVWTIDDDDIATPGALTTMRQHMDGGWTVFRMEFGPGHFAHGIICWREPVLRYGDVGTPMIFAPVCEARFSTDYAGDWTYAQELQAELGDPRFNEEIVALIRPEAHDGES